MGAGASASQVREHVEGLGNAYQPYGTTLEDNGVDGALVELVSEALRSEPPPSDRRPFRPPTWFKRRASAASLLAPSVAATVSRRGAL